MKQLLLFIATLFTGISLQATVRTVSNNPANLAQFNTIQAAIDASAASGDTIYVHGTNINYAGFTITNKQVTVFGPGWSPNKNLPYLAMISGQCIISGTASSGSEINGLVFINFDVGIVITTSAAINNIRIIRNKFGYQCFLYWNGAGAVSTGFVIEGNYFENGFLTANGNPCVNFIIQNNVINQNIGGSPYGYIGGFNNATNGTILINHNLFYEYSSGSTDLFSNCQALTIANNIFVRRNAATGNSNSVFNNNITFNAGNNDPWLANNNVNAGGNISNQDPQMVDQAAVNAGIVNPLLDFTIPSGPANNAGSDVKDMGLLYDANSSLNWLTSRNTRLPFIFSMNVTNPTIPAGGTLNITVEARKNN